MDLAHLPSAGLIWPSQAEAELADGKQLYGWAAEAGAGAAAAANAPKCTFSIEVLDDLAAAAEEEEAVTAAAAAEKARAAARKQDSERAASEPIPTLQVE